MKEFPHKYEIDPCRANGVAVREVYESGDQELGAEGPWRFLVCISRDAFLRYAIKNIPSATMTKNKYQ